LWLFQYKCSKNLIILKHLNTLAAESGESPALNVIKTETMEHKKVLVPEQKIVLAPVNELLDQLSPVIDQAIVRAMEEAGKLRPIQRETLAFDEFIRLTGLSKNQCFKLERLGKLNIVRASPRILLIPKKELTRWERGEMNG
jgi:hypothetical protein